MDVVNDFFKFLVLVAVLMVVIVAIQNGKGIKDILDGFNGILGNLRYNASGQRG